MHDAEKQRDPEIVHEARVAVRRMRASLHVFTFETSAGGLVAHAHLSLRKVGRILGEARDWDVIRTELLPARRVLLDKAIGKPAVLQLMRKALGAQRHANVAARRFVAGADFEATLFPIDRLRLALEGTGSSSGNTALQALRRQRARVLRRASGLRKLDAAARHKLRIEGKRLRYAVELCAWSDGKKWLRALKRIQDTLGKATDAHMLAERIRSLDAAAAEAFEEDERECVRRQVPKAAKLLRDWGKMRAPWAE